MRVVVSDRKYPGEDNFSDVVEDAGHEIVFGGYRDEADMVEGSRGADVLIAASNPISGDVIRSMGGGELILKLTTGYDNVAVNVATECGIPFSNVPIYCTWEVAEHAITLMLAASRRIAAYDRELRAGSGWDDRGDIRSLTGSTLGLIGFGRIGRATATLARGLGMAVVAYDPYVPEDVFWQFGVPSVGLDDLLAGVDYVSVHTPLTTETHHLLGADEFAAMDATTIVVNTARGPIVDVAALVEAVETGEIWGAGLDVFEDEPPTESPALDSDNIVCSPHHAGRSSSAKRRVLSYARDKLDRVLTGRHHGEIVNPEMYHYT